MKSIFVKKLQFPNDTKELFLQKIGNSDFSPELGEGIRVICQNNEYISCNYIIERVYSQYTYNIETNDFEKVEYKRIERIPFFIDFEINTLDIIGNKQQAVKVIEFFGKITKYKIPIADTLIDF